VIHLITSYTIYCFSSVRHIDSDFICIYRLILKNKRCEFTQTTPPCEPLIPAADVVFDKDVLNDGVRNADTLPPELITEPAASPHGILQRKIEYLLNYIWRCSLGTGVMDRRKIPQLRSNFRIFMSWYIGICRFRIRGFDSQSQAKRTDYPYYHCKIHSFLKHCIISLTD